MKPPIEFSGEVADALNAGTPLVALESTIITHGMPFPQNLQTARRVEDEHDHRGTLVVGLGETPFDHLGGQRVDGHVEGDPVDGRPGQRRTTPQ